jgi:hypothetical protein
MTRAGIEPATYGLTYHFGFRRPRMAIQGSWSGLSLCLHRLTAAVVRHPPSSLYTFRCRAAWLGVGNSAFPDFDGIHARHF